MKISALAIVTFTASSVHAFSPSSKTQFATKKASSATPSDPDKPIFDPFGLYPKNSAERQAGILRPLEEEPPKDFTIKDPLKLYSDQSVVDTSTEMSASLPFLKRPAMLDGSLPGDRGFDPFNFSSNEDSLQWYRNAEVKHARIAMLAAVGWPLAELFDKKIALAFDLNPLVDFHDRVPSVLNGGLDKTPAAFWAATLGVTFAIESIGFLKELNAQKTGKSYTPGDLSFDPFNLAASTKKGRKYQLEGELFNGRLAMLAVTGYAIQEWWTQNAVVNETPFFFKPLTEALAQIAETATSSVHL